MKIGIDKEVCLPTQPTTNNKNRMPSGRMSVPVSAEWLDQADAVDAFRKKRQQIDTELITSGDAPSADLVKRTCACIRSSARRLPLQDDEAFLFQQRIQTLEDAEKSKDAQLYSINFASALLYYPLSQIGRPQPNLLETWLAQIISAALTGVALISISDNEESTLAAMNWCMQFANDMVKANKDEVLIGGKKAWTLHWLPILGFDIPAIYFYSSTASIKKFAEMFGRLRSEAFAAMPAIQEGDSLRIIGDIANTSPNNKRWRIALFCTHPKAHGHGLPHFIWWLACLDRKRFEPTLVLFQTPENAAQIEEFMQECADLSSYAPIIIANAGNLHQLSDLNFDLLYNFDDLCNGRSELSAYSRLARNQVTAFYTPATTGCPEMDYFITSPDLDPKTDGEFTEKVVLSKGLPFCFHYASYFAGAKPIDWNDNTIPDGTIVYTMGSSILTKLRPDFVDAVMQILERTPGSICIVMPSTRPKDRVHLIEYILRKCREYNIEPERFLLNSVVNRPLLHNMIKRSDVFLDFFPFSGTNNVLDPLSLGTPCVVMCSNGFSRNRIAASILRTVGMEELIAKSLQEYINIAVELGTNEKLRQSIKARLGRQVMEDSALCDGPVFVRRMENIMQEILQNSPRQNS